MQKDETSSRATFRQFASNASRVFDFKCGARLRTADARERISTTSEGDNAKRHVVERMERGMYSRRDEKRPRKRARRRGGAAQQSAVHVSAISAGARARA